MRTCRCWMYRSYVAAGKKMRQQRLPRVFAMASFVLDWPEIPGRAV
jgi:hypothetical protein